MITSLRLGSDALRRWLDATRDNPVPTGPPVQEALERATYMWEQLCFDKRRVPNLGDAVSPDVLHALAHVISADRDVSRFRLLGIARAYRLVAQYHELAGHADERDELKARIAWLAWSQARRGRRWRAMRFWESRCASATMASESVGAFLNLSPSGNSDGLNHRFLSDPSVVLVICGQYRRVSPLDPRRIAKEGAFVYQWLIEGECPIQEDDRRYLAGHLAFSVSGAKRILGRLGEGWEWCARGKECFGRTVIADDLQPVIEFVLLTLEHERHRSDLIVDRVKTVIVGLEKIGNPLEVWKCRFLEASALRDVGRTSEALQRFRQLLSSSVARAEPFLERLATVRVAELEALESDGVRALRRYRDLIAQFGNAQLGWTSADLYANLGELLCNRGRTAEAIECLKTSISRYAELGMDARVAYVRVYLAQALVEAGHQKEALPELLMALPVLERERVVPDVIVAISLLRKSLQRERLDPVALRQLNDRLDAIRNEAGSA